MDRLTVLLHCLQLLDPVLSWAIIMPALLKEQNLEIFLGKQAKEASLEFDSKSLISPQYFFPISITLAPWHFPGQRAFHLVCLCMSDSLRHHGMCSGLKFLFLVGAERWPMIPGRGSGFPCALGLHDSEVISVSTAFTGL